MGLRSGTTGLALALALGGCSFFSDSVELQFAYRESAHGQTIEPSFDASTISPNEIVFAGQLNTPNPCYRLVSKLADAGNALTLDISAESTRASTCESIVGRFIYEGAIQNLSSGTYQLKVRHHYDQAGWAAKEFNVTLNVK